MMYFVRDPIVCAGRKIVDLVDSMGGAVPEEEVKQMMMADLPPPDGKNKACCHIILTYVASLSILQC